MSRDDRMDWRDVKRCPGCGQPAIGPGQVTFHAITARRGVVNRQRTLQHAGLAQMLGGADSEAATLAASALGDPQIIDLPAALETKMNVCETCAATKTLGQLLEGAER